MDFERGNLLYLTGTAEVIWDGDEIGFLRVQAATTLLSRLGIAWGSPALVGS